MRPSGSDQQGDPQMYIATTHRHTHANHRCYNDLHAPSTARRHCLVAPCVAPHRPLRSVKRDTSSGLIASPLAGTDIATHPHGSLFESVCGVSAKAKKFFEVLAEFPQRPKNFSRCLRSFRKGQKVFRDACGVSANTKKFFVALAEFPQRPRSFSRRLRSSRKGQKVFRGACGVSANVFFFENGLAASPAKPISQSLITHF